MKSLKLQFKIKNFYFLLFVLSFALFAFSFSVVKAAQLKLISPSREIAPSQQFQVDLMLDTEDEEINAIGGKILFPEDLLELKEIRDGNSIISFWVERPKVEFGNQMIFSGITPGGYSNEQGLIFSTIFQSKNEGEGEIEIQDGKVLLNDGKGTPAKLSVSNFKFSVVHETTRIGTPIETKKDTEPPEDFKPEIASDPNIFEGKYFLVFATQDKGSGITYYAIHESTRKRTRIDTKEWQVSESPYVLKDQELRSYIYVKAVDKVGNERVAVLSPKYPLKWYEQPMIWVIIGIGIAILYFIRKILWKKHHTKIH